MKWRLSITIDEEYVDALRRAGRQENRSLSNQIELVLAQWLRSRPISEQIPAGPGRFAGTFSREETYAED